MAASGNIGKWARWRVSELLGAIVLLLFALILPVSQHHAYIPKIVVDGHIVAPWSLSMPCDLEGTLCSANDMSNTSSACAALRARHTPAGMQVSNTLLVFISVLLPMALLIACAAATAAAGRRDSVTACTPLAIGSSGDNGGSNSARALSPAPDILLATLLSVAVAALVTSFLKRNVGRPRPNFYALLALDPQRYAATAYRSFPSGHSSTAMAGLHPLSLWLFSVVCAVRDVRVCPCPFRAPSTVAVCSSGTDGGTDGFEGNACCFACGKWPCLTACVRPILVAACFLPTSLALWVGATRIEDGWHHVGDVIAGELIGVAAAHIALTYVRTTSSRTCVASSDISALESASVELLATPLHSSATATSEMVSRMSDNNAAAARGSAAV